MNEMHTAIRITATAIAVALVSASAPMAGASPYSDVGERNIFGLQDPPEPTPPPSPEKEEDPPPNIKFVGYTTLLGIPRAILKAEIPAKPPTPASVESYILVAGGPGEGGIEVLSIDEENEKARIRNQGKETWLALEKDTPKAAPRPPNAPKPAQVVAAKRAPRGSIQPRNTPNPAIPNRTVRTPQQGGMPTRNQQGTALAGGRQKPVSRITHDYGISGAEQEFLLEVGRQQNTEDFVNGLAPLIPGTPSTDPEWDPRSTPQQEEGY